MKFELTDSFGLKVRRWVVLLTEAWFLRKDTRGGLASGFVSLLVGTAAAEVFGLIWGLIALPGLFVLVVVGIARPLQILHAVIRHERSPEKTTEKYRSIYGQKGFKVFMPWAVPETFAYAQIANVHLRQGFVVFDYGTVNRRLVLPSALFPGGDARWLKEHVPSTE